MSTSGDDIERIEAANDALRARIARLEPAIAQASPRPFLEGLRKGLFATVMVTLVLGVVGGLLLFFLLRNFRMPGG